MNSYPLELLAQLAPVMFVAGLNPPPPPPVTAPPQSNPNPSSSSASSKSSSGTSTPVPVPVPSTTNMLIQPPLPTHHSRHPSVSDYKLDLGVGSGAPTISSTLATGSAPSTTFPAGPTANTNTGKPPARDRPDPFTILTTRLREMLLNQRKVTVWDAPKDVTTSKGNEKGGIEGKREKEKVFQVVLVDKDVRFPPRKTSTSSPGSNSTLATAPSSSHSPLSPLTPTSPLHPDGLIAPLWIRKHTMLVPAVFVLFMRLFEGDGDAEGNTITTHDTTLATAIAQRKKQTNEWGIKLTVVLLASRRMLDDPSLSPTLDSRLTFIRRTSGLDSRAALFVLSPIGKEELGEFVKSLQGALWDPAVEYYTNKSKRVRQKRNRANSSANNPSVNLNLNSSLSSPNTPAPLTLTGWTVRYEYKMACFAEFRGENEVALKHYQDAYAALMKYFLASTNTSSSSSTLSHSSSGSTSTGSGPGSNLTSTVATASTGGLIPRTKRWAEARVLADTISIKIIKLYLYNNSKGGGNGNEAALGMAQFRMHVGTFGVLAGLATVPLPLASPSTLGTAGGTNASAGGTATIEGYGYEYYSWISRMWNVLGELVAEGVSRGGLVIPVHRPRLSMISGTTASLTSTSTSSSVYAGAGVGLGGIGGINPTHALLHPGWYYLFAAEFAERKVERFAQTQTPTQGGVKAMTSEQKTANVRAMMGDVLELYTKSYEMFKAYASASNPLTSDTTYPSTNTAAGTITTSAGANRLPLYIAHRIALTYAKFPDPDPNPKPTLPHADFNPKTIPTPEIETDFDWSSWIINSNLSTEGDPSTSTTGDLHEGKDPEKLLLAAKFLERIVSAGGWWPSAFTSASGTSGFSVSGYSSGSRNDGDDSEAHHEDVRRIGEEEDAELEDGDGEEEEELLLQGGWPLLLLPLLRTWSMILRALIGRGICELLKLRQIRYSQSTVDGTEVVEVDAGEKEREAKEKTLDILKSHVEMYIRVSVYLLGLGVDGHGTEKEGEGSGGQPQRRKGNGRIQEEINRASGLWGYVSLALNQTEGKEVILCINSDLQPQSQQGDTQTQLQPQPIFDTSVVFWYERLWIGETMSSSSSSTSGTNAVQVETPFQLTLTAPPRVRIDEMDWGEARVGVVFEYLGWDTEVDSYLISGSSSTDRGESPSDADASDSEIRTGDYEETEERGDAGQQVESEFVERRKKVMKAREWELILRYSPSIEENDEVDANVEDTIRMIDVGYLDFGAGFVEASKVQNSKSSSRASKERRVIQLSAPLRWRLGQTMIIRGVVGVTGGGVGGVGVEEGRIRISSLLLQLLPSLPSSSSILTPSPIIEIPLQVPARRGIIPLPSATSSYSSSSSNLDVTGGGGGAGAKTQAWWFAGLATGKGKKKIARWAPVSVSASRSAREKGEKSSGSGSGRDGYDYVDIQRRPHPVTVVVRHSGPAYVGEEYPVEVVVRGCECGFAHNHREDGEREAEKEEEVDIIMDVLLQPVETDVTAVNTISIGPHQSNTMIRGISVGSLVLHSSSSEITQTLLIKNTGGAGERVVDMSVRTRPKRKRTEAEREMEIDVTMESETETLKTISIPCVDPLKLSYEVLYRRRPAATSSSSSPSFWDVPIDQDAEVDLKSLEHEAVVQTTICCLGPWSIEVEKVVLKERKRRGVDGHRNVRILSTEMEMDVSRSKSSKSRKAEVEAALPDDEGIGIFPLELFPDDKLADVCRIGIPNWDDMNGVGDVEIPAPGEYEISWRRVLPSNLRGPLSTTHFPLPSLQPSMDELIALLDIAPVGKLHEPLPLTLTIRNRHPTRTAEVYVQLEAAPTASSAVDSTMGDPAPAIGTSSISNQVGTSFVVAGIRAGRVPLLLAGAEECLIWMLIPIECGYVQIPKIRVVDRRKPPRGTTKALGGSGVPGAGDEEGGEDGDTEGRNLGREVKVVDVRVEQRKGMKTGENVARVGEVGDEKTERQIGYVLVLP